MKEAPPVLAAAGEREDLVFARRVAEAFAHHQGDLVFAEMPLVLELWEFPRTIAVVDNWSASQAARLLAGDDIAGLAEYTKALGYLDRRAEAYLAYARQALGTGNEYYVAQYAAIDREMGGLLARSSVLTRAAGDAREADRLAQRAQHYGATVESTDLREAFAGRLTEDIVARRQREREETMASLPDIAQRQRLSGMRVKPAYLSPDPSVRALLEELGIAGDNAITSVLQAFLAQYHSGRLERLRPFFVDGFWPEERLAKLAETWEGWRYRDMGALVTVTPVGERRVHVEIPSVLLTNERNDSWETRVVVVLEQQPNGRHLIAELPEEKRTFDSGTEFEKVLEDRMRRYNYEQLLERRLRQAREANPAP